MGTRSYADVPPTAATIALNAYIFGYAGHSMVTPHAALKQLWWTDERIQAKVTRPFVVSKLRGEEREFLDRPLAFGEGLTDDTYMEWILERAKRLFLILTEVGVPDQIFGCIDDSWDDDDLPISLENVKRLELAYENDEALNRKFYDLQFVYLLRELKQGAHIDYGPNEHIPMEYVNTIPPAVSLQSWDRVHFPGRSDEIFVRRKFPLTDRDTGTTYHDKFMKDVKQGRLLCHEHIANVWASYTSEDAGYVLSDFVGEHTLGTFIEHRSPVQFMRVAPSERPIILCEWMHCLADALASLHHRGVPHAAIRPSNILIDHDNRIAFADVGSVRTFQRGKKPQHKSETYDYAAPESQSCQAPIVMATSPPISSMSAFSKLRKMSSGTSSSSSNSSTGSSTRSNSMCTIMSTPVTPPSAGRNNSMTTIFSAMSPSTLPRSSSSSFRNFSRHLGHTAPSSPPISVPTSPTSTKTPMLTPVTYLPRPSFNTDHDPVPDAPPEASDIYSLACIYLDILTFLLKGKLNDFIRFRSTRISLPNTKQKVRTDSSFHRDPDKIDAWILVLRNESDRRPESIYRAIPELLNLIRMMMARDPHIRPSAAEVRDHMRDTLREQCGIEELCCLGREWETPDLSDSVSQMQHHGRRDSASCHVGNGSPVKPSSVKSSSAATSRRGSDGVRNANGGAAAVNGDQGSLSSRGNSVKGTARRGSAASTATSKLGVWRKAFSKSS